MSGKVRGRAVRIRSQPRPGCTVRCVSTVGAACSEFNIPLRLGGAGAWPKEGPYTPLAFTGRTRRYRHPAPIQVNSISLRPILHTHGFAAILKPHLSAGSVTRPTRARSIRLAAPSPGHQLGHFRVPRRFGRRANIVFDNMSDVSGHPDRLIEHVHGYTTQIEHHGSAVVGQQSFNPPYHNGVQSIGIQPSMMG